MSSILFALIGNPNCGKTSLFNRLTGARAKVANYPGVTVERRSGMLTGVVNSAEVIDLPGTYSLFVTSPDEQVARDMILGKIAGETRPDVLIAVVDATNLRLGLRLVMELKTLNRPMLVALNQMDAARSRGININTAGLAREIGVPVIETVAVTRLGVDELRKALADYASELADKPSAADTQPLYLNNLDLSSNAIEKLSRDDSIEELYLRIENIVSAQVIQPTEQPRWQERLDSIVMHPILGLVVLFSILLVIFNAVFAWATPVTDVIKAGTEMLGTGIADAIPDGILKNFFSGWISCWHGWGNCFFTANYYLIFLYIDSGRYRVSDSCCFFARPPHAWTRHFWSFVYPVTIKFCLCRSRHHVDPHHL